MSADDLRLRELWRERTSADAADADCPGPERIWCAVALELSAGERREMVDHVAACARCAETWRLAAGFCGRTAPQTTAVAFGLPQLALAASLVLAVGLGWLVLQRTSGPEPALRATEPAITSLLEEGQALPRERFLLRWTAGPPGTIYDVEVSTTDLKLLARGTALSAPEYLVPEDALADLPSGTSIAWRVEAVLPDGSVVASVTQFSSVR